MPAVAVIRVRGNAKIRRDAVATLEMLRLHRVNHCVLLPADRTTKGMLQVVKDYVTWGEVGPDTVARLLHQRGELAGGARLTDEYVKGNSGFTSILSFAKALDKGEARLKDLKGLKPVIRLPPPRQGYRAVKKPFVDGGALGNRGGAIEKLIDKMLSKPEEAK